MLHVLSMRHAVESVRVLVQKYKADVNVRNMFKETPLMMATMYGSPSIIDILIAAGAKVDAADCHGNTALKHAQGGPFTRHSHLSTQEKEGIVKAIREALARPGPSADAADKLREKGNTAYANGDMLMAGKYYSESLEVREDYRTFSNRSACGLRLAIQIESGTAGNVPVDSFETFGAAMTDAGKAKTIKPDFAKAWYRFARAQAGLRDFPRAAMAVNDGLKACPGDPQLTALKAKLDLLCLPGTLANGMSSYPYEMMAAVKAGAPSRPCSYCSKQVPISVKKSCPLCSCDPDKDIPKALINEIRLGPI